MESLIDCKTTNSGDILDLSRRRLEINLGRGENYSLDNVEGVLYEAKDGKRVRYFVSYKTRVFEYSKMCFEVVSLIYVSRPETNGDWKLRIKGR